MRTVRCSRKARLGAVGLLTLAFVVRSGGQVAAPVADLPDAPSPAAHEKARESGKVPPQENCELRNAAATMAATAAVRADDVAEKVGPAETASPRIVGVTLCVPHLPMINWYARFVSGPQVKALTPMQKAHLAGRNLVDPYNILTIVGISAITVAIDSHRAEGPGMQGFANNVGVSFTQDMVGEFFGTFLIPSIAHQDPHYHRMPEASIKRRVFHCVEQIAWTQGDNGRGMVNYGDLLGFALENRVNNFYVPGQETDLRANLTRYGTSLALAPIDNFITEFVPDLASRLHVRVVIVQRIINQVARTEGAPAP
jgi:hypothetical protein